jgi:small subunit ribosomal protein S20
MKSYKRKKFIKDKRVQMANDDKGGAVKKKPRVPTPLKREKQDAKKNFANRVKKSRIHTARVAHQKATVPEEKSSLLKVLYSLIDKAAKSGVFKRNKANRLKSRLANKTAK